MRVGGVDGILDVQCGEGNVPVKSACAKVSAFGVASSFSEATADKTTDKTADRGEWGAISWHAGARSNRCLTRVGTNGKRNAAQIGSVRGGGQTDMRLRG